MELKPVLFMRAAAAQTLAGENDLSDFLSAERFLPEQEGWLTGFGEGRFSSEKKRRPPSSLAPRFNCTDREVADVATGCVQRAAYMRALSCTSCT